MALALAKRQTGFVYGDGDEYSSWWYSTAGTVVRYSIVAGLLVALVLGLLVSYLHAQRRIKRGQQPLAYHRWLVPNAQREHNGRPIYQYPRYGNVYPMQPTGHAPPFEQNNANTWAPPPPAYQHDVPPAYQPPPGASKMNPDQQVHVAPAHVETAPGVQQHNVPEAVLRAPGSTYVSGPFR